MSKVSPCLRCGGNPHFEDPEAVAVAPAAEHAVWWIMETSRGPDDDKIAERLTAEIEGLLAELNELRMAANNA